MKIAEISTFSTYSVGKIMCDIKTYIENNTNDSCKIFYARGFKKTESGFYKVAKNYEVNCNAFLARIFDNDGFCLKRITKRLIKQLNEYQPDIIHIHCLHGYYLNCLLFFDFLKKHSNIKVIWTMHDTWGVTGHCCFFSKICCNKWKECCNNCELKREYPKSIIFDNSKKNYQLKKKVFNYLSNEQLHIVVPSNWLGEIIRKSFLNKYKITTINNGINTNIFNLKHCDKTYDKKKKILLGVASVWDHRKGLSYFIKLCDELDDSWDLVIIGKIDKKTILPKRIKYIPRTTNQIALKSFYQNADILFNPTTDDNYPTVNLEAQACGCKVVCFDTGGCIETDCGNLYSIKGNMSIEEIAKILNTVANYEIADIDSTKLSDNYMVRKYYALFRGD